MQREADRLLLSKYVPSAVVVNDALEIVQTRGRTSRYLELPTGKASLNLLKMARPGLFYELRGVIDKVRKTGVPAVRENIAIEDGEATVSVKVEVVPFRTPARDERHMLVLFEELPQDKPAPEPKRIPKRSPKEVSDMKDIQVAQLKQELASTKEYFSPSSRRRKPPTRSCSPPTKKFNPATKNCRARMRNCRPRKKNSNPPMKS